MQRNALRALREAQGCPAPEGIDYRKLAAHAHRLRARYRARLLRRLLRAAVREGRSLIGDLNYAAYAGRLLFRSDEH